VLPAVLKAALRFLHADLSALSLYDRRTQQHHTVAVASTDGHWSPLRSFLSKVPAGLTCESDGESGDVLVLPDDDPRHPFASVLQNATSAAAYVTLRDEDAMLGTLHVVRPAYLRFSQDDRLLVRGIGDHAMLALATVVVV
jgi:GAF domain-containing protein